MATLIRSVMSSPRVGMFETCYSHAHSHMLTCIYCFGLMCPFSLMIIAALGEEVSVSLLDKNRDEVLAALEKITTKER